MYSISKICLGGVRQSYLRTGPSIFSKFRNIYNIRLFSNTRRCQDANSEAFNDVLLMKALSTNKQHSENAYIRCTIFDSKGDIVVHGKDIRRLQFMKTHNLVPRDFRKITRHYHGSSMSSMNNINVDIVPSIVTRGNSILLNLSNIKALIKSDTVVIFDSLSKNSGSRMNESHSHGSFLKDMNEKLKTKNEQDDLPYEFRALECILIHVMLNLTTEMNVHKTVLQNILSRLEESIERVKLRYLLIQSKKIAQFHQKTKLIRDLLDNILEQNDELNALYLTEISKGKPRLQANHAEAEMLLESYYKTIDEIVQTVENLRSQIKTSEEIINIVLDSNRNELMLLGLKFSTGLLSMGCALYIAALYGMNLENFIEETDGGFELVVGGGSILLLILLMFSVRQLKKVQRITMTGMGRENSRISVNDNQK
ncbi:unnamed protein product [Debaryomyces tyrocola]|nr:unnamed protein product [Debaryomyces tyrocola]